MGPGPSVYSRRVLHEQLSQPTLGRETNLPILKGHFPCLTWETPEVELHVWSGVVPPIDRGSVVVRPRFGPTWIGREWDGV